MKVMDNPISLWSSTANKSKERPSHQSHLEFDVAIIGGGFTGLATAYYLQRFGYRTVILEQGRIGGGASGRNAGMLIPGYKMNIQKIDKKWGTDFAAQMLDLTKDAIEEIKKIVETYHIDCSLSPTGSISAAFKESHFETFKRNQEYMERNFGYSTFVLNKQQMSSELGTDLYQGVSVDPHGVSFQPLNYLLGLADVVEDLGGTIFEQSEVLSISYKKNQATITTPKGTILSSKVVIATNGYTTPAVSKTLTKSVIPVGSYMIATEPLDKETAKKLIPNNRVVSDSKKFLYYFRLTPDDRMLFGGRVSFTGQETPELYEIMRQSMLTVFPELKDVKTDYTWGGLVAMTMDMLPHIGTTKDGTYYALGYSGRGAAISTMMGKLIALNIQNENYEKSNIEKIPLKEIPFHSQRGIALNVVGMYYALQDKFF